MNAETIQRQRSALAKLRDAYSDAQFLKSDPIEIPAGFSDPGDVEIAAFLSAMFAYGNVTSIRSFLHALLAELGPGPRNRLIKGRLKTELYYRFQTATDISSLLNGLGKLIKTGGGLESHFGQQGMQLRDRIAHFQLALASSIGRPLSRGLTHLIGDPTAKSAQKRYCMYLRWMVRSEFPDFGLYRSFSPRDLIVPLDLHVARMAKNLGWSSKDGSTWANAETITRSLRILNPPDPLQVDFPLTRPGILGLCKSRYLPTCESCEVRTCCQIYSRHA
ncbi:MAG: TIGR02757 family protein [Spirochaetia bacterium]|nr:TIGR02757 family protein [Spirochaetia bacterium]